MGSSRLHGMLTDSRSILSMTRHELFRRILCDVIGKDVDEAGSLQTRLVFDGRSRHLRRQWSEYFVSPLVAE